MLKLINIPNIVYDWLTNGFPNEDDVEHILEILRDGITIPDNATNGDVIKAMFGNNVFAEDEYEDEDGMTWIDMISDNGMTFEMDWWNAPYKRSWK